jgi:tRNA (guanine-N7-)-methyltransferase
MPSPKEHEFGVPIPGEILPPERWAKTALKRLPAEGPLSWIELFGRSAPVVADLGCGNGRYLLSSALAHPAHDHIGIDILPLVLRYATRRGNQRGLSNLRFAAIDAQTFLAKYVLPGSLAEIHCYHPQPFHARREAHRRLFTPEFLARVQRSLTPGGLFFFQTDNRPYGEYMKQVMPSFFEFHEQNGPWPDARKGRTRREIIALRRRLPIFRGWGQARTDLTADEITQLVGSLPRPDFDAGPPNAEADRLERGEK